MSSVIDELERHIKEYRQLGGDILELWFHLPSYKAVQQSHPQFKDLNEAEAFLREHYSIRKVVLEAREYFFSLELDYVDAPAEECPCGCTENE